MSSTIAKKKQPVPQNVKVVVKVRPLTRSEEEQRVKNIINCISVKEILLKEKKYIFDKIFKPFSGHIELYVSVVAPLIRDVITGYNCTIFAYGQTGSGKTYTMTGDKCAPVINWKEDTDAGIIPRAAFHIFDELGKIFYVDINVKVSYIELYNEEIRDLLSTDENSLQLFNDTKGGLIIHGLKEVSVHSSEEICKLLQRGILKRQIAPTLMNHQSSRSHTVFTISVNISESKLSGEDILKMGKINLVDLAGSENIAKAGCKDVRAQELANINRSLLTLGRVIHCLAEKTQKHVPYRDSKLTRILQDSLGGHTKTVIIATVSPAHTSHEETASTLEYAMRARHIKNAPVINEKLCKHEIIEGLNQEIERLQKDLDAAREGTGFYVDKENYQRILDIIAAVTGESISSEELTNRKVARIKNLEQYMYRKVRQFEETMELCKRHQEDLDKAKLTIKEKHEILEQERFLAKWYEEHSCEKFQEAQNLLRAAHVLSNEKEILLAKLESQFNINLNNETTAQMAIKSVLSMFDNENLVIKRHNEQQNTFLEHLESDRLELRSCIRNVKKISGDIDRETIDNFSIHKAVSQCMNSKIEVIRKKLTALEIMKDQLNNYQTVMPDFIEKYRGRTLRLVGKATNMLSEMNEESFSMYVNMHDSLISVLNSVELMRKQDEDNLKRFEEIIEITKRRVQESSLLENRLSVMKNSIVDYSTTNLNRTKQQVSSLEQYAYESIKSFEESVKSVLNRHNCQAHELENLVSIVKQLEDELLDVSNKLDNTYKSISGNILDSLANSAMLSCSKIEEILDGNIGLLKKDIEAIVNATTNYDTVYRKFAENVKETLIKQILEKNVPARHAGDTPAKQQLTYPTQISQSEPREVLIEKFRVNLPRMIENGEEDNLWMDENDIS